MDQKITAVFSIILVYWTALLKSDEHQYHGDTGSCRNDTSCLQVVEIQKEFSAIGNRVLFWVGVEVVKWVLRKSVSTVPAEACTVPAETRTVPAETCTVPAKAHTVPAETHTAPA